MSDRNSEDIIGALYDMVQDARSMPLAADKCILERDKVLDMLDEIIAQLPAELLADYARRRGSCVILKGLRAGSDFENEFQMALINRKINPELDTMFLTACSEYMYLSSSLVKELGSYGADLSDFLPAEIIPDFQRRLEQRRLSLQGGK